MEETQGKTHVVHLRDNVKDWPPPVGVARPPCCVKCAEPAFDGARCMIHGHGLRGRLQRGPRTAAEPAERRTNRNRRFECQRCGAVMVVVPPSTAPFKHFSGASIGMALALWALCGHSAAEVREQVSDRRQRGTGERGWPALRRWAADTGLGKLFGSLGVAPLLDKPLAVARRVAQALCGAASALVTGPYEHQAFDGACQVS